jgi:hypothetical protein
MPGSKRSCLRAPRPNRVAEDGLFGFRNKNLSTHLGETECI